MYHNHNFLSFENETLKLHIIMFITFDEVKLYDSKTSLRITSGETKAASEHYQWFETTPGWHHLMCGRFNEDFH